MKAYEASQPRGKCLGVKFRGKWEQESRYSLPGESYRSAQFPWQRLWNVCQASSLKEHCFFFLGMGLQHVEVPRQGVKSELQLRPTPQPQPQPQQCGIWATSATYITAHGNTGSLTHWAWSGIKPKSSRILVGYHWATTGTPVNRFLRFHQI